MVGIAFVGMCLANQVNQVHSLAVSPGTLLPDALLLDLS